MNDIIACTSAPHHGPAAGRGKAWLLGTASALVLGATISSPVWAVVYPGFPATYYDEADGQVATGYTTILAVPVNTDLALSATIQNGVAGTVVGPGSSATVTANTFAATAGGNDVSNSITGTTLPLPNSANPSPDGIAVLGDSLNTGVAATSLVANSYFAQELLANASGNATVSNNTMSAATILNNATTTIQGQVPLLYISPIAGYSGTDVTLQSVYYPYFALASIIGTSVQENYDSGEYAGSGAMVTESYVGELFHGAPSTPQVVTGGPAVTGNALSAAFTGNLATTAVTVEAGGAQTFLGSAAVTNAQLNAFDGGSGTNPSAIVKYSFVGIGVFPGGGEDASATLTGSAAVTGNSLMATAIGNQASGLSNSVPTGNVLTLAGGIRFSGAVGEDTGIENEITATAPVSQAGGAAVVANTQVNYGAPLTAETKQSAILGVFSSVYGGTASLSSNTIAAEAIGNEVYNALLAPGLGSPGTGSPLDGPFALSNLQQNSFSPITAFQFEGGSGILAGRTLGSTLTVDSNAITASALGNSASNVIDLNSSNLESSFGSDAVVFNVRPPTPDFMEFETFGDVMLNSLQSTGQSSPVTAINQLAVTGIVAGLASGVAGSTLSVTNTASAALAEGNAAANSIALTGGAVSTSAALLSSQSSYSAVSAGLFNPINTIFADPSNSVLTLTGNLQRAIATGNAASNTLTVTGSDIFVASESSPASNVFYIPGAAFPFDEFDGPPAAAAGFVAFNDQATAAPVTAEVTFAVPSLLVGTLGYLQDTSVTNSTNTIVAAARANQATTQLTVAPTNSLSLYLGGGEDIVYSPFASATTVQTLVDGFPVTARITAEAGLPPIYNVVGVGTVGATLTSTGNQIQTLAQGNNAINGLTLSGAGTVAEPAGSLPYGLFIPSLTVPTGEDAPPPFTTITADAAFAVSNLQYAGTGFVSAHQYGTGIEDNILGNTNSSTIEIGGSTIPLANVIGTAATANLAANTLTLNAADLSASSGILNYQLSEGPTVATLTGPVGFAIDLRGTVNASTIGINGNQVDATATANAATNTATSTAAISSSSLLYGVDDYIAFFTGAGAFTDAYFGTVVAADLGLLNSQTVGPAAAVVAESNGTFTIKNTGGIAGSAVSISDNAQLVTAAGNQATNSLALSPGITPADAVSQTASLLSTQSVTTGGEIAAESNMLLSAPMSMISSSLTMSGNTNTASAVANEAVNTVTVAATASVPGFQVNEIGYTQGFNGASGLYGYADYSVFNVQSASGGTVGSEAYTRAGNNDLYTYPAGIVGSSVTFDSNSTVSQALANSAVNTLSLTVAGTSGAIATVASNQTNSDAVVATATIDVVYALGQFTGSVPPSSHTSYAVTNNTTQALATGNQASNALNVSASAYGTPANIPGSNVNTGYGPQTSATYTVLNSQYNSGPVTATAYGASPPLQLGGIITTGAGQGGYGVALRTAGVGNTATVSGNTVSAQAIGNRASNALTLVALNTGSASSAINSVQTNSAPISASVSDVTFGVAATLGTAARVSNNQLSASAFGNVVTNAIVTH